jgi:hypothetical protein
MAAKTRTTRPLGRKKGAPHKIVVEARVVEYLELRKQGLTMRAIAAKCGTTNDVVCKAIHAVLNADYRDCTELVEDIRRIELERYDAQTEALWPAAMMGDPRANDVLLRVSARRAALLGLDAPTKTEVSGPNGSPIELADARARLAEGLARIAAGSEPGAANEAAREPTR